MNAACMWGVRWNEQVQTSPLMVCGELARVCMRTFIAAVLPEACIVVQPKSIDLQSHGIHRLSLHVDTVPVCFS